MAVVTVEEIEPFLPVTLTIPQRAMVEDLIDLVEAELVQILNRTIEIEQTVNEVHVINLTEPVIYLKNTPVISVDAATSDGNTVSPGFYQTREWGLDFGGFNLLPVIDPVIWTPSSSFLTWWQTPDILLLASGSYPQGVWTVTYTAGLDGPNLPALRSVLIKAIRREIGQIFQGFNAYFVSMQVEDYKWQHDPLLNQKMVGSFTQAEIKLLDQLKHKNYS